LGFILAKRQASSSVFRMNFAFNSDLWDYKNTLLIHLVSFTSDQVSCLQRDH
jgi:hypothetical protein